MGSYWRACIIAGLTAITVLPARAAENDNRRAQEYFRSAETAYQLGKFDDAVVGYEKAYELSREPGLLFNLAQAHRLAGHAEKALHLYRSYLRQQPRAANRDSVEALIRKLESEPPKPVTAPPDSSTRAVESSEPTRAPGSPESAVAATPETPAPLPTAPTMLTSTAGKSSYQWTSLRISGASAFVAGVISAAFGTVLLVKSHHDSDAINEAANSGQPWTPALTDRYNGGESHERNGIIALAAGGGVAALGAVLYVLGAPDEAPRIGLAVGSGSAVGTVGFGF